MTKFDSELSDSKKVLIKWFKDAAWRKQSDGSRGKRDSDRGGARDERRSPPKQSVSVRKHSQYSSRSPRKQFSIKSPRKQSSSKSPRKHFFLKSYRGQDLNRSTGNSSRKK